MCLCKPLHVMQERLTNFSFLFGQISLDLWQSSGCHESGEEFIHQILLASDWVSITGGKLDNTFPNKVPTNILNKISSSLVTSYSILITENMIYGFNFTIIWGKIRERFDNGERSLSDPSSEWTNNVAGNMLPLVFLMVVLAILPRRRMSPFFPGCFPPLLIFLNCDSDNVESIFHLQPRPPQYRRIILRSLLFSCRPRLGYLTSCCLLPRDWDMDLLWWAGSNWMVANWNCR